MKNSPLLVGLTGGIASGKSTAAQLFYELGAAIIDADDITRALMKIHTPVYEAILAHFGNGILNSDGSLNRKQLREIIFSNPTQKTWLENLLHPLVWRNIKDFSENTQAPYTIAVVPLLFETQVPDWMKKTLVICCDQAEQLSRVLARDGISEALAKSMVASQMPAEEKCKRADFIIQNSKDITHLKKEVLKLHELFLNI